MAIQKTTEHEIRIPQDVSVMNYQGSVWLGDPNGSLSPWMIVTIALVTLVSFITVGVLLLLGIFVGCLLYRLGCIPRIPETKTKIKFDLKSRLMYSSVYQPIPFDQLTLEPVIAKCGVNYVAIYTDGIPQILESCYSAVLVSPPMKPNFIIMRDYPASLMRRHFDHIILHTNLQHLPPLLDWEEAKNCNKL
jgi:hypothetical protein